MLARENKSITTSDFLAYLIQDAERRTGVTSIRLLENIDRVVNITDPQTNRTIATAPAKYVEVSYSRGILQETDFHLLVLSNDGNTGYVLIPSTSTVFSPAEELPPEHQQIFDSFELVAATNATAAD